MGAGHERRPGTWERPDAGMAALLSDEAGVSASCEGSGLSGSYAGSFLIPVGSILTHIYTNE